MSTPEERFAALGLELPPPPKPMGVYKPALVEGVYLYVSGHGTMKPDGSMITGKVGQELDADAGKLAARQVGLSMIASIKATVGSLDRIHRVVKVLGMVWATPEFDRHPYVINGCSELFSAIWVATTRPKPARRSSGKDTVLRPRSGRSVSPDSRTRMDATG